MFKLWEKSYFIEQYCEWRVRTLKTCVRSQTLKCITAAVSHLNVSRTIEHNSSGFGVLCGLVYFLWPQFFYHNCATGITSTFFLQVLFTYKNYSHFFISKRSYREVSSEGLSKAMLYIITRLEIYVQSVTKFNSSIWKQTSPHENGGKKT